MILTPRLFILDDITKEIYLVLKIDFEEGTVDFFHKEDSLYEDEMIEKIFRNQPLKNFKLLPYGG